MSIEIDWEVSEAPDQARPYAEDDALPVPAPVAPHTAAIERPAAVQPAPAAPARRGRPWRGLALAALGVLAFVAVGAWFISRSGWRRVVDDLTALVRYEEQQSLAGNVNLVMNVQDGTDADWATARAAQVRARLPAPRPVPMLDYGAGAMWVENITALDGDSARADVFRVFSTPSGQTLTFMLPQFYYRRGPSDWVRTAPPLGFWGEWTDWKSDFLHIRHSERDAALVAALAPRLSSALAEACAVWADTCGRLLPAKLYLSGYVGSLHYNPLDNVEVRVEFGKSETGEALPPDSFVSVPSPHLAGVPTDEASTIYLADYLTVRMIAALAGKAVPTERDADRLIQTALARLDLHYADPGYAWTLADEPVVEVMAPRPQPTQSVTAQAAGQSAEAVFYVAVEPGDTLSRLALLYGVTVEHIVRLNNIADPDLITEGQILAIPVAGD